MKIKKLLKLYAYFAIFILVASGIIYFIPDKKADYSKKWAIFCQGGQSRGQDFEQFCNDTEKTCQAVVAIQKRPCSNYNTFSNGFFWVSEAETTKGNECQLISSSLVNKTTSKISVVKFITGTCTTDNIKTLFSQFSFARKISPGGFFEKVFGKILKFAFKFDGDSLLIAERPTLVFSKNAELAEMQKATKDHEIIKTLYSNEEWAAFGDQFNLHYSLLDMISRPVGVEFFVNGCKQYQGQWVEESDYAYCKDFKVPEIEVDAAAILPDPELECKRVGGSWLNILNPKKCIGDGVVKNGVKTIRPPKNGVINLEELKHKKCMCGTNQCLIEVAGKMTCVPTPAWSIYF